MTNDSMKEPESPTEPDKQPTADKQPAAAMAVPPPSRYDAPANRPAPTTTPTQRPNAQQQQPQQARPQQIPVPPPPKPKASGNDHFQRSETLTEFAKAFARAQGRIGFAMKESENTFFASKYADMASVVAAIRGPFAENGLGFLQFPRATDEGIEVETLILHESGEWVSDILSLPTMKIDPQGYGQAITYCCRYAIRSMAGVAPEEDDGNKPTQDMAQARNAALKTMSEAAAHGPEAFERAWKELPMDFRKSIQRDLPGLRAKIAGAPPSPKTNSVI